MASKKRVLIAIGGNSLISDAEHMSVMDQYQAAGETAKHIASLVEDGHDIIVTHGNGPQVGFILLRSELARNKLHEVPLEICVADTQGAIGYQIEQSVANELKRRGIQRSMATIVTQVVVNPKDPAFNIPSKPVGPFLSEAEAKLHGQQDGWVMKEDSGRGWRRVVPSPFPSRIVEEKTIKLLMEAGIIVTCVGGGGIPVVQDDKGELQGVPAVIDKDAASALLAQRIGIDLFIITTAVDKVCLNFGTPEQKSLDRITLKQAEQYLEEGHFADGSMKPKIQAAIDYLEAGGKHVIITQPHLLEDAVAGKNGTHIVP